MRIVVIFSFQLFIFLWFFPLKFAFLSGWKIVQNCFKIRRKILQEEPSSSKSKSCARSRTSYVIYFLYCLFYVISECQKVLFWFSSSLSSFRSSFFVCCWNVVEIKHGRDFKFRSDLWNGDSPTVIFFQVEIRTSSFILNVACACVRENWEGRKKRLKWCEM